tara:strand:- start:1521 stop:1637 length:117 start_codon:yes stop_codon:yes gene_type:complete
VEILLQHLCLKEILVVQGFRPMLLVVAAVAAQVQKVQM